MKTTNGFLILEPIKAQGIQKDIMAGIATPSLKTLKVGVLAFDYEDDKIKLSKGTKVLLPDDLFKNNKTLVKLSLEGLEQKELSLVRYQDIIGIL